MRRSPLVPVAAAVLVLAACSSGGSSATTTSGSSATTSTSSPSTPGRGRSCDQGASMDEVTAKPVSGVASDLDLTSFDGTTIRIHWFPVKGADADHPAPTIAMGPGWSETGDTSTTGSALFDSLSIPGMWKHGYNVVTWDPRGFGKSGGVATVNDPDHEGRDVQAIFDWIATQPEAQQDGPGDPRVGMAGFSYGGGIQLTTAAIDCRVDAIVPGIAWHSLETSLYKAKIVKQGWADLLVTSAASAHLDPHITSAHDSGTTTGTISTEDQDWFRSRGPGDLVGKITAPTLILQGTVDNLFTLDEGITNYRILRDHDVPVAMRWFCGGHGACLTKGGTDPFITDASFAWFDRYLKGDRSVDTGPRFETIDQDGKHWSAADYPVAPGTLTTLEAKGSGTLDLRADGGSGGVTSKAGDLLGGVVADITPSKATNAVNVPIEPGTVAGLALGAPTLELTYTGARSGDQVADPETHVFAQLVDDATGIVVGNQITPIPVTLDGTQRTVSVPLEAIAHHITTGQALTLQLVATSTTYAAPAPGGRIGFDRISISIPVARAGGKGGVTHR